MSLKGDGGNRITDLCSGGGGKEAGLRKESSNHSKGGLCGFAMSH